MDIMTRNYSVDDIYDQLDEMDYSNFLKDFIVDCDKSSSVLERWTRVENRKNGIINFYFQNISLYLTNEQESGVINGYDLIERLAGKTLMNENVLNYLLKHPEFIPEECREKKTFFLGTIYRHQPGILVVRFLHFDGLDWGWDIVNLDSNFGFDDPIAILNE